MLWWILTGAEAMVLVCGGNLQVIPREGALRLYYQLALPRLAEYKGVVARLKLSVVRHQKWIQNFECLFLKILISW